MLAALQADSTVSEALADIQAMIQNADAAEREQAAETRTADADASVPASESGSSE